MCKKIDFKQLCVVKISHKKVIKIMFSARVAACESYQKYAGLENLINGSSFCSSYQNIK